MDNTTDMDGGPEKTKSRRGWILLAGSLGATLLLSACGKNHKNKDDEDEEDPPPAP